MNDCLTYLPGCSPAQEISIKYAINDISLIRVYRDKTCYYDTSLLQYQYSLDGVCWSCYMDYTTALANTMELNQDFFVNIKVAGPVSGITIADNNTNDYSTQLAKCFDFAYMNINNSSNVYNPYANMGNAVALQQALNDNVAAITGIPIYYFKLAPDMGSKDITFKEYTLMNVEAVKQIKLIVADGQMPSSRPEFSDWGLDFQADWECEISKSMFATAFGNTAQPLSGDLIYIPMMKRMWMVNEAYEEKNGSLMWNASTFKVMLVKYQEKGSVDLGNAEDLVSSFVKNKYDDLFGEDDRNTLDSGFDSQQTTVYAANNLYAVYESDATRKYVTCDTILINNSETLYYKGTMIADSRYVFNFPTQPTKIIYQKEYCGNSGSCSFIVNFKYLNDKTEHDIVKIGTLKIRAEQFKKNIQLTVNKNKKVTITISANNTYLIILRWSDQMNLVDFYAYEYTYPANIPMYKLNNAHYFFDIDNPTASIVTKYDIEFRQSERKSIELTGFSGWITNFKVLDMYLDNVSELMQMYPTNQHLLVNDTARRIIDAQGVPL